MDTRTLTFKNTSSYSTLNGYWMARLSRMAYRDYEGIRQETKDYWGNPIVTFYNHKESDSQACILEFQDFALLAFRGTEPSSYKDWLTDFNFIKKNYDGFRVHGGFLGAVKKLLKCKREVVGYAEEKALKNGSLELETLEQYLKRLLELGKELHLTGHSLGGGLVDLRPRQHCA